MAVVAAETGEASGPNAARDEVAELALDKCRQAVATGAFGGGTEEGGQVLAHDAVEHGMLGVARAVGAHRCHRHAGAGRPVRVHRSCAAESAGSGRARCAATALRLLHGTVINDRRGARDTTSSGLPGPAPLDGGDGDLARAVPHFRWRAHARTWENGTVDQGRRAKTIEDDRDAALYHVVYAHEGFEESARALFTLVRRAQAVKPGKRRRLFLDIEGHRNSNGGFDADMLELQKDFLVGFLAPFLSEMHCPLVILKNPRTQDDDIPDELIIQDRPRHSS